MKNFREELIDLINRHSLENGSDTPDYILAHFIERSLDAFNHATNLRSEWHGCRNEKITDIETIINKTI